MTYKIYCCGCAVKVDAVLTSGAEIYPHRPDLRDIPFWKCPTCFNYVGCHHKTSNRTHPLGNIPTPEIRQARQHIHRILDPLWKRGTYGRKEIYSMISVKLGFEYHTAQIRSVEEARKVYSIVVGIYNHGDDGKRWVKVKKKNRSKKLEAQE